MKETIIDPRRKEKSVCLAAVGARSLTQAVSYFKANCVYCTEKRVKFENVYSLIVCFKDIKTGELNNVVYKLIQFSPASPT